MPPQKPSKSPGAAAPGLPLQNLSFVFTGDMEDVDRETAQDLVKSLGGKTPGTISGKTDYLVRIALCL